ncbi:MAG TPA: hypothetical protein VFJ87_05960 [Rhodanobacteraceae bacterium]|nr:hypothetical protein [Rhodanobacteraceae bacterium]
MTLQVMQFLKQGEFKRGMVETTRRNAAHRRDDAVHMIVFRREVPHPCQFHECPAHGRFEPDARFQSGAGFLKPAAETQLHSMVEQESRAGSAVVPGALHQFQGQGIVADRLALAGGTHQDRWSGARLDQRGIQELTRRDQFAHPDQRRDHISQQSRIARGEAGGFESLGHRRALVILRAEQSRKIQTCGNVARVASQHVLEDGLRGRYLVGGRELHHPLPQLARSFRH